MLASRFRAVGALVAIIFSCSHVIAAEEVGEAVVIKTAVTGSRGPIEVKEPVYRDERIRTSNSGLGQFVFRDGTKLAVGWGSSVVIDKFVYDDSQSVKKFTVRATKGTFRWISGDAGSSAYRIITPAGTIGVRGTAFDFYVGRDGTTAVVLLNGSVQFCGANGCQELKRRCDCIVASPRRGVGQARRVNRDVLGQLGNARALPFLSGDQALTRGFLSSSGCGLTSASFENPGAGKSLRAAAPTPSPPNRPDKPSAPDKPSEPDKPDKPAAPDKPSRPDTPAEPSPTKPDTPADPDKPQDPEKPDKPDKPSKPDRPDKPDKPGKGKGGKWDGGKDGKWDKGGKGWGKKDGWGGKGDWGGKGSKGFRDGSGRGPRDGKSVF